MPYITNADFALAWTKIKIGFMKIYPNTSGIRGILTMNYCTVFIWFSLQHNQTKTQLMIGNSCAKGMNTNAVEQLRPIHRAQ